MLSIISPYVSSSLPLTQTGIQKRPNVTAQKMSWRRVNLETAARKGFFLADSLNQTLFNGLRCYSVHDP